MKKKIVSAGLTILFLVVAGICYSCNYQEKTTTEPIVTSLSNMAVNPPDSNEEENTQNKEEVTSIKAEEISQETFLYVHLCGAVEHPNVYKVEDGTRLVEIIELAGGLTKTAAADFINQAMKVEDGQRIYIPTEEEMKDLNRSVLLEEGQDATKKEKQPKLININQAEATELMELPGIGKAKADSILEYRNSNGKFEKIEDLMNIPGIKEGLFQQMKSLITVK